MFHAYSEVGRVADGVLDAAGELDEGGHAAGLGGGSLVGLLEVDGQLEAGVVVVGDGFFDIV